MFRTTTFLTMFAFLMAFVPGADAMSAHPPPTSAVFDTDAVGFNPQPEPPAYDACSTAGRLADQLDLDRYGFNPQPEPPALPVEHTNNPSDALGLEHYGFNPQPEPPAHLNCVADSAAGWAS